MWMCILGNFYIPLFWKIGNIWRVKKQYRNVKFGSSNVLYLTFFFFFFVLDFLFFSFSFFDYFRVSTVLIRSSPSLVGKLQQMHSCHFLYWKITSQMNIASGRNVNCVNWGPSANQYYSVDHPAHHISNSDCL